MKIDSDLNTWLVTITIIITWGNGTNIETITIIGTTTTFKYSYDNNYQRRKQNEYETITIIINDTILTWKQNEERSDDTTKTWSKNSIYMKQSDDDWYGTNTIWIRTILSFSWVLQIRNILFFLLFFWLNLPTYENMLAL